MNVQFFYVCFVAWPLFVKVAQRPQKTLPPPASFTALTHSVWKSKKVSFRNISTFLKFFASNINVITFGEISKAFAKYSIFGTKIQIPMRDFEGFAYTVFYFPTFRISPWLPKKQLVWTLFDTFQVFWKSIVGERAKRARTPQFLSSLLFPFWRMISV